MLVKVGNIRQAWNKSKREFAKSFAGTHLKSVGFDQSFWDAYEKANHIKVHIAHFQFGFPVIHFIEFKSERDYVWFMLKWS